MRQIRAFIPKVTFFCIILLNSLLAQNFSHFVFSEMLRISTYKGKIDYNRFLNNTKFDQYLKSLSNFNLSKLESEDEKLAFFINAYNAHVIKNVVSDIGIKNVNKNFFTVHRFVVAGMEFNLESLNDFISSEFQNPLVHFALIGAANGFPYINDRAYESNSLNKFLELNFKNFIQDTLKNRLDRKTKTYFLSELFKWYKDDFESEAGSIINFILPYLPINDRSFLKLNKVEMKFTPFDWTLNKK
ncbi:MAG: DUF547 domain-containing protein [Ignavibacteria bacterium]|nr:DUF547 domain-containing protein [Ignavibacteria bacterium]